ncbi:Cation/H(+) antiporter 15 [Ananas comosus]|uniref:Cation/H(+) antiporter 15 n=1 Tax=Ananas comosus TaxID=4615 RepID=A0A199V255_ANACO|nr:Cation/H(+) antiporter 15 [Ananas comosus]
MGKTLMSRVLPWDDLHAEDMEENLNSFTAIGRIFIMFLIGLEIDLNYLWHTRRRSLALAYGGALSCALLAAAFSPLLHSLIAADTASAADGGRFRFAALLMLILSNTASPVVVRIATELKLTTSETGRLAIAAALTNDMTCLLLISLLTATPLSDNEMSFHQKLAAGLLMLAASTFALVALPAAVRYINAWNERRREISNYEVLLVMVLVAGLASLTEMIGYNNMMMSFLLGLVFPREGPTMRTMMARLAFPVHNVVLPLYFAVTGMRTDFTQLAQDHTGWRTVGTAVLVVVLSTVGKVAGTVAAANHLKIPFREGMVLGFILNAKGHVDIITMSVARKQGVWGEQAFIVLLITVFVNTLMAGPAAAAIVRRERSAFRYHSQGLEWTRLDGELRVLTCVHGPRDVLPMLSLAELSGGTSHTPIAVYLLHLVELTQKYAITLMYHQRPEQDVDSAGGLIAGDDTDYGGDDVRQVNVVVDAFTRESSITVRQMTAVSSYANMHEDVCNGAEDIRACLVLVPFHKEQRYDGRMLCRKDGRRHMNLKVLQHAPCTVGILVDRRMGGGVSNSMKSNGGSMRAAHDSDAGPQAAAATADAQVLHHVVAIFFGGPDDREAVAYAGRLAMHPSINMTVIRFLHASDNRMNSSSSRVRTESSSNTSEVAMMFDEDRDAEEDEEFMANFHNRFVASGIVTYLEKYVGNGPESVTALSVMAGMYSLFIVGKGGDRKMPTTAGIGDWEECSELGPVGDLLASEDFMDTGSVLVLQQHRLSKTGQKSKGLEDEFLQ